MPGCITSSAKTGTVPRNLGWLVILAQWCGGVTGSGNVVQGRENQNLDHSRGFTFPLNYCLANPVGNSFHLELQGTGCQK